MWLNGAQEDYVEEALADNEDGGVIEGPGGDDDDKDDE